MNRREVLALLGGAPLMWTRTVRAEQRDSVRRIGVLLANRQTDPEGKARLAAFTTTLQTSGWSDPRNLRIEARWFEGDFERAKAYVKELIGLAPDAIVVASNPALIVLQAQAPTIPIVFTQVSDPVEGGFVKSLARPGGNITGLSGASGALGAKTLELIRDVLPSVQRVAVLANATDPFTKPWLEYIVQGGHTLGLALQTIMVRDAEEFAAAFAAMDKERSEVVLVQGSLPRAPILDLALKHRLPAVGGGAGGRLFALDGGLISYSANQTDNYRRAAYYIDRILKGAKAADLPVEQPTRFELVVNLRTAKALGIVVPATVLARADEVIE
jgi:putative ABC transport system substrate-binding protein